MAVGSTLLRRNEIVKNIIQTGTVAAALRVMSRAPDKSSALPPWGPTCVFSGSCPEDRVQRIVTRESCPEDLEWGGGISRGVERSRRG